MNAELKPDTPIKNFFIVILALLGIIAIGWRVLQMAHFVADDAAPAVGRAASDVWRASDPTP